MNFLNLCQRVHLLARFGEDRPGSAPTTVVAQVGPLAEIVGWVQMAYEEIQNKSRHWLFLNKLGTMAMVIGQSTQDPAAQGVSDFDALIASEADRRRSFVGIYTSTTADETPCYFVPYEEWVLSSYHSGLASAGNGRPVLFTVNPQNTLEFYPKPDLAYNVRLPYKRTNHALAADGDLPLIPAKNDMAIVWWVIVNYYCTTRESTREFRANAKENLTRAMNALNRDQLPDFTLD